MFRRFEPTRRARRRPRQLWQATVGRGFPPSTLIGRRCLAVLELFNLADTTDFAFRMPGNLTLQAAAISVRSGEKSLIFGNIQYPPMRGSHAKKPAPWGRLIGLRLLATLRAGSETALRQWTALEIVMARCAGEFRHVDLVVAAVEDHVAGGR